MWTTINDFAIALSSCGLTDAAKHITETEADQGDKWRRIEEPETPLSSAVQDDALELSLVSPDFETSNDEAAAGVCCCPKSLKE